MIRRDDQVISVCDDQSGTMTGRSGREGVFLRVAWRDGLICSIETVPPAPDLPWLMPGLIDLQVNGFSGIDFQNPQMTEGELEVAVTGLRRSGCQGFLLTLITDDWKLMLEKLGRLVEMRRHRGDLARAMIGFHLEGPFLSAREGFRGAHSPAAMCDPPPHAVDEIIDTVGTLPVLLTVAPERPGMFEFIREATRRGLIVSLGHSAATSEQVSTAIRCGAKAITHFGNGCPQVWPRHDNWFWTVVDCEGLAVGLIPDGIHLPERVFRGIHHALGDRHQIYYTTDAMSAAGMGPGTYPLGREMLSVGDDEIVRQPGQPNYAGSALTPLQGISRSAQMLSVPWREVWHRFSVGPAALLGRDLEFEIGAPWFAVSVSEGGEGRMGEITVFSP